MMSKYYQSSGKVEFSAIVYLLLVCVTILPVLSFLFAISSVEIPYIVLKIAFPVIFAILLGACINMAIIFYGKTRNGLIGFLLSSVACVWAYHVYWIFYFVYVSNNASSNVDFTTFINAEGSGFFQEVLYLLKNPKIVWIILKTYISIGSWNFLGISINGGILIFLLIVEVIVIYLVAVFIGFINYDKPFDELNKKWFRYELLEIDKYFLPEDELVYRLENRDYNGILDTNPDGLPLKDSEDYFSKHTIFYSGSTYYLSIENVVAKLVKEKRQEISTELIKYIEISPQFASELRSTSHKRQLK